MLHQLKHIAAGFSHLIFPHNCLGCATDVLQQNQLLCAKCATELPVTNFTIVPQNPVEKMFYGRIKINTATAAYYFTKQSLLQHLLKQLKYKGNKDVGIYLGKLLGYQLSQSNRFNDVDALLPLPLNYKKEKIRGYNQAKIICDGIVQIFDKPIINDAVIRTVFTTSQTKENRMQRWQNIDGVFKLINEKAIANKHILLIDDVLTTGATLESCGIEILKASNTKLSIATVALTAGQ